MKKFDFERIDDLLQHSIRVYSKSDSDQLVNLHESLVDRRKYLEAQQKITDMNAQADSLEITNYRLLTQLREKIDTLERENKTLKKQQEATCRAKHLAIERSNELETRNAKLMAEIKKVQALANAKIRTARTSLKSAIMDDLDDDNKYLLPLIKSTYKICSPLAVRRTIVKYILAYITGYIEETY